MQGTRLVERRGRYGEPRGLCANFARLFDAARARVRAWEAKNITARLREKA
jgi:hypothetical protein